MKRISILHAPTPLGLRPPTPGAIPGTRAMPEALRAAGLHARLHADFAGDVLPGKYEPLRHREFGVLNPRGIRDHAVRLAQRIRQLLDERFFPLVLGGDCSIVIGCALALRRTGRSGLVFLDGHADCLTPSTSATGGVAGMDLAIATGTGPELLCDIEVLRPYVRQVDAVQVGSRDPNVRIDRRGRMEGTDIRVIGLAEVRMRGPGSAAERALSYLRRREVDTFWLHLDADVLEDAVMPAVDSRQPGGLMPSELVEMLRVLLRSSRAIGMDVTIYDPELDPTREIARSFTDTIAMGFGAASA